MKRRILPVLLSILLAACSLPTPSPTPLPPTQTPRPTQSPVPPSPTPVELTLRVGTEKINCRFGPGVVYAFVNELAAEQSAHVIGRNESSTWWYIRDPGNPDGRCWVAAQVTKISGDADTLPVVPPPLITVTKTNLRIEPLKIFVACDQFPQTVFFEAEVTAIGPALVVWRLEASSGYISTENTLIFEESGMQVINGSYQVTAAGDYWLRLHILSPNDTAVEVNFPANCSP